MGKERKGHVAHPRSPRRIKVGAEGKGKGSLERGNSKCKAEHLIPSPTEVTVTVAQN